MLVQSKNFYFILTYSYVELLQLLFEVFRLLNLSFNKYRKEDMSKMISFEFFASQNLLENNSTKMFAFALLTNEIKVNQVISFS